MSNILSAISNAIAGKPAAKGIDPRLAVITASIELPGVVLAVNGSSPQLSETKAKVEQHAKLIRQYTMANPELEGRTAYQEQQQRSAGRVRASQPAEPEDTWAEVDFIEQAEVQRDSVRRVCEQLTKEIEPVRPVVMDAYCRALADEMANIEKADAATYAAWGQQYEPSALVLTIRDAIDMARASYDVFVQVLIATVN